MTTPNLEDIIRDLAKRGELNHISLSGPSATNGKFKASFAMCSKFGISFAEDHDPVKAITLACTTAKMKPRPAEKRPSSIDETAERIGEDRVPDPVADLM